MPADQLPEASRANPTSPVIVKAEPTVAVSPIAESDAVPAATSPENVYDASPTVSDWSFVIVRPADV